MKLLRWLALLPTVCLAQTANWSPIPWTAVQSSAFAAGASSKITFVLQSKAAANVSVQLLLTDQFGINVPIAPIPEMFGMGQQIQILYTFTTTPTGTVGGPYHIGVTITDTTGVNPAVTFNNIGALTVNGGLTAEPPTTTPPPPVIVPPPVVVPPPTASTPPSMPICGPTSLRHMNIGAVPPGVETGSTASPLNDTWIAYTCTAGATAGGPVTGYLSYALLFNAVQVAPYIVQYKLGSLTMPQLATQLMSFATALTPAEKTFTTSLLSTNRPLAQVAPDGASATQPVYTNASGSLALLPNETVVSGLRSDETNIVGPDCSVAGLPDQNGVALPAGSFAACTINLPNGTN